MPSDEGEYWDERFRREGYIWGEAASPTARTALQYLPRHVRVLEVGFGYGRDITVLLQEGHCVWGIDLSREGRRQTEARLDSQGLAAKLLLTGSFQDNDLPDAWFDAVLSHRMAHLLVTDRAVERFSAEVQRVLRPGGLLFLTVRNDADLSLAEMRQISGNVYEYKTRPGHCIRYWDDQEFQRAFGKAFTFLALNRVQELESATRPVPCHLTLMVGQKVDSTVESVQPTLTIPHQA